MKILILTRSAWDDSNSTGNTISNLFSNFGKESLANIYLREPAPNNDVCKYYYSISDISLIKSLFKFKAKPGRCFTYNQSINPPKINTENNNAKNKGIENKLLSIFRGKDYSLMLWAQNLLWALGTWKNKKLNDFLDDFNPDIIFSSAFSTRYSHRLLWYIQKKTNAKLVVFNADDFLLIKENCKNPFEKLESYLLSKTIAKTNLNSDLRYCIAQKQADEYTVKLNLDMKVLYKGYDFSKQAEYEFHKLPIKLVYIGSTMYGRWKTLSALAKAIAQINVDQPKFELEIYSQYEPSSEIKNKMVISGASKFMGSIPASEVKDKLKSADIVLHLESFDKEERARTRLSFSTKIADCLNSGRCLMAIGWEEAASIDYLIQNEAAIVITDIEKIISKLQTIASNPQMIKEYANKGWNTGKRNHDIKVIQKNLENDFQNLLGN